MKKLILILFLILFSISKVNADSDYTLIDCVNGDNDIGIPFDSTMPYATLKSGIENTIDYINNNINKVGNEEVASGKTLNIKVKCSFNDILNQSISLNFNGVDYNNELLIEGTTDNSFIIKDIDFQLGSKAGNIIFKNAQFLNEDKPYFYDFIPIPAGLVYATHQHPISNGVKIIDSYIGLKNGNNIGNNTNYKSYNYNRYNRQYSDSLYNYFNKQFIENSVIDIEIDNDFSFRMPVFMKNSQVNFTNKNFDGPFNITFLEDGNINSADELNFSIFVSNEINLGGNNLLIEDTKKISLINNNLQNFDNLSFSGSAVFINNYFENNSSINISGTKQLYNNIFKSGFTDSYDITNNRKNFSENNAQAIGLGWIYKRLRAISYFNIDINSADLYKEITGKILPKGLGDIYVIFNY